MNYSQAIQLLESFIDYEKLVARPGQYRPQNYNLHEFTRFLTRLGNPEQQLKCIHIAGTKGKGSIATMLSSILTAQGYRTGLFLSPHLYTFRERIQINGQWIEPQKFSHKLGYLVQAMNGARREQGSGFRTVFELLTAMAFLYFQEQQVELAVIETGLGGRLDATNVVKPLICIISIIGLDHTILLGSTIESVTREKAGIIKPQAKVVVAPQHPNHSPTVMDIISKKCQQEQAELIKSWKEADVKILELTAHRMTLEIRKFAGHNSLTVECPFIGLHQLNNLKAVLSTINQLRLMGISVSDQAIIEGLRQCQLEGRVEVLSGATAGLARRQIVIDGAHCPVSIEALVNTLRRVYPRTTRFYMVGLMADKNITGVMQQLANDPMLRHLTVYNLPTPRSCPAEALASKALQYFKNISVADSPEDALMNTRRVAGDKGMVVACGSMYSLARLKAFYQANLSRLVSGLG